MNSYEPKRAEEWSTFSIVCLVILGIVRLAGEYVVIPINVYQDSLKVDRTPYCIATQIERHKTPAECPETYKGPMAKFVLNLSREDSTTDERLRFAKDLFGTNTDQWPHGLYRSVFDSIPTVNRIELYRTNFPYCSTCTQRQVENFDALTDQFTQKYATYIKMPQTQRLQTISTFERTMKQFDVKSAYAISVFKRVCWYGLALVNILSLIVFLSKGRPRSDTNSPTRLRFRMIFFPLVLAVEITLEILALIFLPHRTWLKGTIERKRLRKELGEDVITFLNRIQVIRKKLRERKIPEQKRFELEEELRGVEHEIEQLRQERLRMLKAQEENRTDTPEHEIGEEIEQLGRQVTSTREIDRTARMQTSSGLAIEFEAIERQPSKSNAS